jgi:hypothetical protein
MPETMLTPLEGALARIAALEEVVWEMLVALESGDEDEIAKAKRKMGLVLADL